MKSHIFSKLSLFVILLVHSAPVESFLVQPTSDQSWSKSALSVSFSSNNADEVPERDNPNRHTEFNNLEPIEESSTRRERMQRDQKLNRQFVSYGDDLWTLRKVMNRLSRKLIDAINGGFHEKEEEVRDQLREVEKQDPELQYGLELQKIRTAKLEGRPLDAEYHSQKAMAARDCVPVYNLEGLWVGK